MSLHLPSIHLYLPFSATLNSPLFLNLQRFFHLSSFGLTFGNGSLSLFAEHTPTRPWSLNLDIRFTLPVIELVLGSKKRVDNDMQNWCGAQCFKSNGRNNRKNISQIDMKVQIQDPVSRKDKECLPESDMHHTH